MPAIHVSSDPIGSVQGENLGHIVRIGKDLDSAFCPGEVTPTWAKALLITSKIPRCPAASSFMRFACVTRLSQYLVIASFSSSSKQSIPWSFSGTRTFAKAVRAALASISFRACVLRIHGLRDNIQQIIQQLLLFSVLVSLRWSAVSILAQSILAAGVLSVPHPITLQLGESGTNKSVSWSTVKNRKVWSI